MIFSSGMSRRPDFKPALAADHSIGIDIGEMSPGAMVDLAAALTWSKAHVFVDSGAFAAFRSGLRGKPCKVNFRKVFDRYEALQHAVSIADDHETRDGSNRLHFVLPDVVGDQQASLALLREFQWDASAYNGSATAILPVQGGDMHLIDYYDAACEILEYPSHIIGVPSSERAVCNTQLFNLINERHGIWGVHVLGAASATKAGPRIEVMQDAEFDGDTTFDANRLRGYWNQYGTRNEARDRLIAGLPPKRAADVAGQGSLL